MNKIELINQKYIKKAALKAFRKLFPYSCIDENDIFLEDASDYYWILNFKNKRIGAFSKTKKYTYSTNYIGFSQLENEKRRILSEEFQKISSNIVSSPEDVYSLQMLNAGFIVDTTKEKENQKNTYPFYDTDDLEKCNELGTINVGTGTIAITGFSFNCNNVSDKLIDKLKLLIKLEREFIK